MSKMPTWVLWSGFWINWKEGWDLCAAAATALGVFPYLNAVAWPWKASTYCVTIFLVCTALCFSTYCPKYYMRIYPCHISAVVPHYHPVLPHSELQPVLCIQLIREIDTLNFVILMITHFGNLNVRNCLVPKIKWEKLFVVLVLPWPPPLPLDHLFAWMDCQYHCESIAVHPKKLKRLMWS